MSLRKASWLLLAVTFASSSTGFAQQRLPIDPRAQPTLPGGARPPPGGFTLTPPVVTYRGGSSATTATEATFATTLSGTSFEWTFGGGAIPNTATSTTPASPTVVLARPGTYTARVVARGPAGMREGSHAYVVNPFRRTSVSLATDPSLSRGESDRYTLMPGPGGDVTLLQCARVGAAQYTRLYARRRGAWTPFDVTTRFLPEVAGFSTACESPLGAMGSDGRIRFVSRRGPTRLSYFSANTALPTSPAEWTESVIADDAAGGRGVFALRSDNRAMVSFNSGAAGSVVKLAIANSPSPTGPKDWVVITPVPFMGTHLVMAPNRDAPAILFHNRYDPPHPDNGVRLAYATTASPRTAADFRVVTLPRPTVGSPGLWGGQWPALTVYEGRFVAVHHESGGMKLVRATVESPTTMADFATSFIEDRIGTTVVHVPTTIQTFQGRLVVSYSTGGAQRVAIARTRTPSAPADWEVFSASPHEHPNFALLPTSDGSRAPLTTAYWIATATADRVLPAVGVISDDWR